MRTVKMAIAFLLSCGLQLHAQDMQTCPMHKEHAATQVKTMEEKAAVQQQSARKESGDPHPEFHAIKSLTAEEIKAYEEGTGYGMAKAAEQNHYPGPRHVLDLSVELQLSEQQLQQIRMIRDAMSNDAIRIGRQLIESERELNAVFAAGKMDSHQLDSLITQNAALRGRLRLVHLSAHLQTQRILSPAQIEKYDQLRGYKSDTGGNAGHPYQDHPM